MQKFNGKVLVGDGVETNSEMTTLTKNTKLSGSKAGGKPASRAGSPGPDDLDEAATMGGAGG